MQGGLGGGPEGCAQVWSIDHRTGPHEQDCSCEGVVVRSRCSSWEAHDGEI